jgi:hypothetical protein
VVEGAVVEGAVLEEVVEPGRCAPAVRGGRGAVVVVAVRPVTACGRCRRTVVVVVVVAFGSLAGFFALGFFAAFGLVLWAGRCFGAALATVAFRIDDECFVAAFRVVRAGDVPWDGSADVVGDAESGSVDPDARGASETVVEASASDGAVVLVEGWRSPGERRAPAEISAPSSKRPSLPDLPEICPATKSRTPASTSPPLINTLCLNVLCTRTLPPPRDAIAVSPRTSPHVLGTLRHGLGRSGRSRSGDARGDGSPVQNL